MDDVRTSQKTPIDLHGLLQEIALSFLTYMMFVPHRKHAYEPPRPVTGIALLSHFYFLANPSNHTVAVGSTQPLTEMRTSYVPRGKGRPCRKADNLTAICEPIA
jgi:hypothetical protein